jgi:hypothetical protein
MCVSPHGEGFLWRDCWVYIRGSGANFSKYWLYWLKGQCMVKIVYICAFKNCICADSFWTSFIFIFCILCIFWDGKNFLRFFNKQPFLAFGIDFWNYFEKWQFLDKTGRCANHGLEYGLACIQEANCCAECWSGSASLDWWDCGINIDNDSHWLRSDTAVLSLWRINIRAKVRVNYHPHYIPSRVIKSPWKNSSTLREEYIFCVLKTPYLDS